MRQLPGRLKDVKVTVVENTAMAARLVAQSERTDVAALSSRFCAEEYGLNLLEANVQDQDNNYTRFICISKNPEIYPGADRTSLMMTLPHKPGSLYNVLSKFYALGINLRKLESRPLPDREFEFMFYFDLECSVYAPEMERIFRTWRARVSSCATWHLQRDHLLKPWERRNSAFWAASWATAFPPKSTACWGTIPTISSR